MSTSSTFYETAPPAWRALLAELGGRPHDGTPGVRDVDAQCDVYEPVEVPMDADGHGDCETDGHYLCADGTSVCTLHGGAPLMVSLPTPSAPAQVSRITGIAINIDGLLAQWRSSIERSP